MEQPGLELETVQEARVEISRKLGGMTAELWAGEEGGSSGAEGGSRWSSEERSCSWSGMRASWSELSGETYSSSDSVRISCGGGECCGLPLRRRDGFILVIPYFGVS